MFLKACFIVFLNYFQIELITNVYQDIFSNLLMCSNIVILFLNAVTS